MILAINTSTPAFSIALMGEKGEPLSEYVSFPLSRGYVGFMPALHELLMGSGTRIQAISALAVAKGPGSFTGLRVGLSAAKGISQALRIPLVGVSSLEAMAYQAPLGTRPLCCIMDSRRGEVFSGLYCWQEDQMLARIKGETCLKIEDLASFIDGETLFLGNDYARQAPRIRELLGSEALIAPAFLWSLRASAVGWAGLQRILQGDYDNLHELAPSYMRPPDIRPNPYPLSSL